MKIDDIFVKKHIDKWTNAWNNHNLKEILSLHSDNILFHSPKIKSVFSEQNSATIINKKGLHFIPVDYFMKTT